MKFLWLLAVCVAVCQCQDGGVMLNTDKSDIFVWSRFLLHLWTILIEFFIFCYLKFEGLSSEWGEYQHSHCQRPASSIGHLSMACAVANRALWCEQHFLLWRCHSQPQLGLDLGRLFAGCISCSHRCRFGGTTTASGYRFGRRLLHTARLQSQRLCQ